MSELREFEPYDRQFARLFGLEDAHLPLAALRRLGEADAAATEPGSHWLCADPVNLSFAREHLLLHPFADDALGIDEAATLITALNELFTDLGHFEACTPTRWYLRLKQPTEVTLYALDDVIGRPIKHFLPEGKDARLWQRTMNEAQIVLHNHAASQAREAAGKRPVNSLWLWGAGTLTQNPRAPAQAVQATDPLSLGMARRGREADAEAAEVEIDVARGPQLHFDRRVAPGRDFAQLQCAGEAAADFGTHLSGVERYAGVARTDDKSFARGRADAVVVGETDVAGRDAPHPVVACSNQLFLLRMRAAMRAISS